MAELCRRLARSAGFQRAVLALIVANALVMGLATWPALDRTGGRFLSAANVALQGLFILEMAVRLAAHGRRPLEFFRSGWNLFDFAVVALSLLPAAGPLATVARLARVLRVARLASGVPELRLIIGTMLRSVPSMGHVAMLLGLLVYVYGLIGHHLFGEVDPQRWGSLGRAAETLFMVMTLEGWGEIMRASKAATPWAWVYYLTFIVVAVFVVINLFIAVVINNMEKVRREDGDLAAPRTGRDPAAELRLLAGRVDDLAASLRALAERSGASAGGARSGSAARTGPKEREHAHLASATD